MRAKSERVWRYDMDYKQTSLKWANHNNSKNYSHNVWAFGFCYLVFFLRRNECNLCVSEWCCQPNSQWASQPNQSNANENLQPIFSFSAFSFSLVHSVVISNWNSRLSFHNSIRNEHHHTPNTHISTKKRTYVICLCCVFFFHSVILSTWFPWCK